MRVTLQPHYTAEIIHEQLHAEYIGSKISRKRQWKNLIMADVPNILINLPSSVYYGVIALRDRERYTREMYIEWRRPRIISSAKELITATMYTYSKSGKLIKEDITALIIDEVTRQAAM